MYIMPSELYSQFIWEVARNGHKADKLVYWSYSTNTLASIDKKAGRFIAIKIDPNDICFDFLPSKNSMLRVADNKKTLTEAEDMTYVPVQTEFAAAFPKCHKIASYRISRCMTHEAQRCIRELTKGKITIKSLSPMLHIPFSMLDVLEDRVELRTESRDALLVVRYRSLTYFRRSRRELQYLLEKV